MLMKAEIILDPEKCDTRDVEIYFKGEDITNVFKNIIAELMYTEEDAPIIEKLRKYFNITNEREYINKVE